MPLKATQPPSSPRPDQPPSSEPIKLSMEVPGEMRRELSSLLVQWALEIFIASSGSGNRP